jgi:hypothetical protein
MRPAVGSGRDQQNKNRLARLMGVGGGEGEDANYKNQK